MKSAVNLSTDDRDGRIEIEPAPREVRIVRKGRLAVAVPTEPSEPLTRETVRRTQKTIRAERRALTLLAL